MVARAGLSSLPISGGAALIFENVWLFLLPGSQRLASLDSAINVRYLEHRDPESFWPNRLVYRFLPD